MLNDKDSSINHLLLPRDLLYIHRVTSLRAKDTPNSRVHLVLGHPVVKTSTEPITTTLRNSYPAFHEMANLMSLQRPPSAPLPRTDIQLMVDAWRYLNRQIQKHRARRLLKAEAQQKCYDSSSEGSIISKADTLVVSEEAKR